MQNVLPSASPLPKICCICCLAASGMPGHVEFQQFERDRDTGRAVAGQACGFGCHFLGGDLAVAIGVGIAAASGQQDRRGERRGVDQAHRISPSSQAAGPRYRSRLTGAGRAANACPSHRPGRIGTSAHCFAATVRHMSPMAELVIRRGLEEPDTSAAFVPHKPQRPEKALGGRKFELVSDYQPSGDQPARDRRAARGGGAARRPRCCSG